MPPENMLSAPPTRLLTHSIAHSYIKHAGILSGPDCRLMDGLIISAFLCVCVFFLYHLQFDFKASSGFIEWGIL